MSATFNPPAQHHERHWMSSGNVVLSAISQDKTCTVLFRLHKSMLSNESEVFDSMFSLPQGDEDLANCVDYYDTLPLVRLSDTAEEVGDLLNAIRDPLALCEPTTCSDTPLRIRNALHLASKYLMTDLRQKLVRIVEREWPSSLEDMEIRDQAFEEFTKYNRLNMGRQGWPTFFIPEPAAAIVLTEEFGIESILPFAYYDLTRCSVSRTWDTCLPSDGQSFVENCVFQGKASRWEYLSAPSILKMLRIRGFLRDERSRRFKSFDDLTEGCYQVQFADEMCQFRFKDLLREVHAEATSANDLDQDVIKYLRHLRAKIEVQEGDFCGQCRSALLQCIYEVRRKTWHEVEKRSRSTDGFL